MEFKAWDYQKYAIRFIRETPEALVLLDMGLGKTVITLTAIRQMMAEDPGVRRVLVIAPLRVATGTWPQEVMKWDHTADLRLSLMTGSKSERCKALRTPADIYVINRDNLAWLIGELEEAGVPWPFDTVVIDCPPPGPDAEDHHHPEPHRRHRLPQPDRPAGSYHPPDGSRGRSERRHRPAGRAEAGNL